MSKNQSSQNPQDNFIKRHIGPSKQELSQILESLKVSSLEELIEQSLPEDIYNQDTFTLPPALNEKDFLELAQSKAKNNKLFKSYIGMGYKASITPGVLQRNILENPIWYTSYTPYQAELAQGRLEALLNFQTMVTDLTGMEVANASLLDEGTALAEALNLAKNANENKRKAVKFFADSQIYPQSLEVLKTRSEALGWEMIQGSYKDFKGGEEFFAVLLQYPDLTGSIEDIESFLQDMSSKNCFPIVASDLLSLTLLKPPGEMGAKVVAGSSQNFGIPLFFGGPHAAFFATKKDYIRLIPGRIVGVSKDRHKNQAYRLSLQTREQHIRREKATSNICTAQALLAVMASFYALYHGPKGLKEIALKINKLTQKLYELLKGFKEIQGINKSFFDSLSFKLPSKEQTLNLYQAFQKENINLGFEKGLLFLTLNETSSIKDIKQIQKVLEKYFKHSPSISKKAVGLPKQYVRKSLYLQHPVFNSYHTETEMLRYIHRLQNKELSLTHSMIP